MAHVLVLGGGFGGLVAAESLARRLGPEHRITLVSRGRQFLFYPALVRLAFGRCEPGDISFDLRHALETRGVSFMQAEVVRIDQKARSVTVRQGDDGEELSYDYLIYALGRRLATDCIPGLFEHAHHLLTVESARKFGEAVKAFHGGHAVVGYCPDARLTVPVYETAFELDRWRTDRGSREEIKITVVSPEPLGDRLGGPDLARRLYTALIEHGVEFKANFPVEHVTATDVGASYERLPYDLLMLIPPFRGPGETLFVGLTDGDGYIRVEPTLRVTGADRMYAAGDAVNFPGPKMGHMAVLQGEVAAANVAAEIEGRAPMARYRHELMLVIDEGGADPIFLHQELWEGQQPSVHQGRFWGWAKRIHERYWQQQHG